jgi:hypothetical protein
MNQYVQLDIIIFFHCQLAVWFLQFSDLLDEHGSQQGRLQASDDLLRFTICKYVPLQPNGGCYLWWSTWNVLS